VSSARRLVSRPLIALALPHPRVVAVAVAFSMSIGCSLLRSPLALWPARPLPLPSAESDMTRSSAMFFSIDQSSVYLHCTWRLLYSYLVLVFVSLYSLLVVVLYTRCTCCLLSSPLLLSSPTPSSTCSLCLSIPRFSIISLTSSEVVAVLNVLSSTYKATVYKAALVTYYL
jgi:hypothetical protein